MYCCAPRFGSVVSVYFLSTTKAMWATSHDDATLWSYCQATISALSGSGSLSSMDDRCAGTKVRTRASGREALNRGLSVQQYVPDGKRFYPNFGSRL